MIARTSHVPETKPKSDRSVHHKGDCIADCNDVHRCNDDTPSGSFAAQQFRDCEHHSISGPLS